MKEKRLIPDWLQANMTYIEQWIARPGRWNRIVPGCPKQHESTISIACPVIHPTNY